MAHNYKNRDYPGFRRTNQQLQEAIANILLFDVSDPRLRLVTVTGVDVSPDKRNAKIYYTSERSKYEDIDDAFAKANPYIKKLISERLSWRVVPQLNFYLDKSVDFGEIIDTALQAESKKE